MPPGALKSRPGAVTPAAPAAAEPQAPPDEGTGGPARSSWRDKLKPQTGPGQQVSGDAKKYAGKLGKKLHVSDPAGAMAGILVYALVINGIRYGTAGITGWFKAKFLNQPMQGQAVDALSPTGSSSPTKVVST